MSILEFFQYDFTIRALLTGLMIAVIAPSIGLFLVARRYAYIADTLAHVSLAGVAIGYVVGLYPVLTAMVASIAVGLTLERMRRTGRIAGESGLVLFISGSLALAAVLLSASSGFNVNLMSVLFGSITTVSTGDVVTVALLGVVALTIIFVFYHQFFAIVFDEDLARSSGVAVDRFGDILIVLTAMTVALSMRIVGILLVGALMVIPVVTALQWRQGFLRTMVISVVVSVLSVVIGLWISFVVGLSSGGTIVLVTLGFAFFSMIVSPKR